MATTSTTSDTCEALHPEMAIALVALRTKQLKERFEVEQAEFVRMAAVNPSQAIEWNAKKVMKSQHTFAQWDRLTKRLTERPTVGCFQFVLETMKEEIMDAAISGPSQSTCQFTNANDDYVNAARAECYKDVLSMFKFDGDEMFNNL